MQSSSYRWLFDKLQLNPITLDVDSTVLTRWGSQIEGAASGYNPKNKGRHSHHLLMAFVADWRLVANLWLRPGNTASSNNIEEFIEATLENLGATSGQARAGIKTVLAHLGGDLAVDAAAAEAAFAAAFHSDDFAEGAAAFLGKRPPTFTGALR